MYVVFGANGRAGGATARSLMDGGHTVRVVLRRREQGEGWTRLGADVAVADMADPHAMAIALDGASGAFLLNPPPVSGDPYLRADELGAAIADAARRAGLTKAVVLSSIGAQHASGTGLIATLGRYEKQLDGVVPNTTFLRSGYFVETWAEVSGSVLSESLLPTFIAASQKIPMVSTVDVGRAAAGLLIDEWTGTRLVELSGPQDWSAEDVAAAFGHVLDRPISTTLVPTEDRAALLAREHIPDDVATALLGMYEGIANGLFAHQHGAEQQRGSVSLTTAIESVLAAVKPTAP